MSVTATEPTIEEQVLRIFNTHLKDLPEGGVTRETTLEDLNIDSFDLIEVTFLLEEEFDVDLATEDAEGMSSVADFIDRFEALVIQTHGKAKGVGLMTVSRRVVVTGLGVISAAGAGVPSFSKAIFSGDTAIAQITHTPTDHLQFDKAAEIGPLAIAGHARERELGRLDRFSQLALMAADEAIEDAGLEGAALASGKTGVVLGAGLGGLEMVDRSFRDLYQDGKHRSNPVTIPKSMPNASSSALAMAYGVTGPSYTVCTACASSNHAIGQAFWMIRSGLLDRALAGGSDAPLVYSNLLAWSAMRVVSPDICRPFSKGRIGMNLGESGGVLFLESEEAARARGARIHAELAGFGMSADAGHFVIPSGEGAAAAISAALEDGGLAPEQVGYINAHGTGTEINDKVECAAIRQVLRASADSVAVSSTKGTHGHALGGAGALEAVSSVLALTENRLPPTANFLEADPDCDLDIVVGAARERQVQVALSNAFAFGGLNAVLAFRRAT